MDPTIQEFRENIVVRVELIQVIIPELVRRDIAWRSFPGPVPRFDCSEVSSSMCPLKKRVSTGHYDNE